MTNKDTTAAPANAAALATTQPLTGGALAKMPDDLVQDAGRGTENIDAEDVRPPRLRITQSGSPQRKPENEKQIVGLQELDMFNDLSGQIYGRGPLNFVVISSMGAKGMQFSADGTSVVDFDVPLDDDRMQFTTNSEGKRVKPIASKIYNYLIWLPEQSELLVLSLSSTLIATAIKLNGLMKLPLKIEGQTLVNPPAWARTFALETKMKQSGTYAWGIFNLSQKGITDAETRSMCRMLADSYGKKNVIIEHDADDAIDPNASGDAPAGGPDAGDM